MLEVQAIRPAVQPGGTWKLANPPPAAIALAMVLVNKLGIVRVSALRHGVWRGIGASRWRRHPRANDKFRWVQNRSLYRTSVGGSLNCRMIFLREFGRHENLN